MNEIISTVFEWPTYKNSRRKGKVRDFYDRVDAAHYVLDEDYPDAAADAQKWQHEASKLAHHKCNVFLAFLADIKSKVELKDVTPKHWRNSFQLLFKLKNLFETHEKQKKLMKFCWLCSSKSGEK